MQKCANPPRYVFQGLFPRRGIGENDAKKDGGLTSRVCFQPIGNLGCLWSELANSTLDLGVDLPLVNQSGRN